MKKILFVDHSFHRKTRSADFFVDVLRKGFEVETFYLTPEERPDPAVIDAARQADIVVLWQMDFLAPLFLSLGKAVVVIPMFDGSGGMPALHWLFAHKARFLNFSLVLNERIRMAGGSTMLLRYFPEPVAESELPRFDQLRAFFWQRRPDHGLHFDLVDAMLGSQIDALHVHDVSDVEAGFVARPKADASYTFTRSTWFKDKADFARCLARANVFVAPRVAEGIGMALLEAMAQGKLVLAHDAPTNSEYVSNWVNGVLFDKNAVTRSIPVRERAARLGKQAWRTVVEGRRQWLASHPAIIDWIAEAQPGPAVEMDHVAFMRELWASYYAPLHEYVSFLSRNLVLLERLTDWSFTRLLDAIGESREEIAAEMAAVRDCALDDSGEMDLTREDDRFVGKGWSNAEPGFRWAVGHRSEVSFSGLPYSGDRVACVFTASALPNLGKGVQCTILLNGKAVFDGRVKPGWADYRFSFDVDILRIENEMILCFDKAMSLPEDRRELSVCFKQFAFKSA